MSICEMSPLTPGKKQSERGNLKMCPMFEVDVVGVSHC
jgi:hypothetical protein